MDFKWKFWNGILVRSGFKNGIIGYKLPFRTVYCFYWIVSQYSHIMKMNQNFFPRSGSCGVRSWGNLSLLPVFKTLLLKRLRLDPSSLIFNMLKLSFTRPRPPSPVTIMLSSPILNHCRKFEIFLMKMLLNAVEFNFGNTQYSTPSSDGQMTILAADI